MGNLTGDRVFADPVEGGWPLLEVDTNQPVDVALVVTFVRSFG